LEKLRSFEEKEKPIENYSSGLEKFEVSKNKEN